MLGTLLNDRYKIIQELGRGGFGQTYLAEDTQDPQHGQCVVKQLKPGCQDAQFLEIARRLFITEVATLRQLGSHDQIPALLDDFEVDAEFYFVQEYIAGLPLSRLLTAVPWHEVEVLELLQDVLQVLAFIHRHQVIHRDVKPSNIIRRLHDGKFVLIDFGAVKEIQTQSIPQLGQNDYTVGISTPGYGPSEQLMGKPRYNSDIYALGMTAIQALTGLQPTQLPTHPDTGEVVWEERVIASLKLRTILRKMVRSQFSQRYLSAEDVLAALAATEIPEDDTQIPFTQVPGDTVLAPSDTELAPAPMTVIQQSTRPSWLVVGVASLAVTGLVYGLRYWGGLQPLELAIWDRFVQLSADPGPDSRILIVGITDADIAEQKQFPLSDQVVAQTLKTVYQSQPRAIGLALLRDVPQEPGRQELQATLKSTNTVVIANNITSPTAAKTLPLGLSRDRIGFNDVLVDADGMIRRNLLFADVPSESNSQSVTVFSFAFQMAIAALAPQGITPQLSDNAAVSDEVKFGKGRFRPLESNGGGYQHLDARGYQILMQYRGRAVAPQVSLTDLLNGRVAPDRIKDKIVLIGTTAISSRDLFLTPYSAIEPETPRMAGVVVYAHMLSQILDIALKGQQTLWVWPEGVELVWIGSWAIAAGLACRWLYRPLFLGMAAVVGLGVLGGAGFVLFLLHGWVPLAAPTAALLGTGAAVSLHRISRSQISDSV